MVQSGTQLLEGFARERERERYVNIFQYESQYASIFIFVPSVIIHGGYFCISEFIMAKGHGRPPVPASGSLRSWPTFRCDAAESQSPSHFTGHAAGFGNFACFEPHQKASMYIYVCTYYCIFNFFVSICRGMYTYEILSLSLYIYNYIYIYLRM